jgi:hemerythrin-like domain-containing protein
MFDFFKKKKEQKSAPTAAPAPAPSGGIQYYPELIKDLIGDHRRLFDLHDSIKTSFARRELALVSGSLKEFGVLVRNHLLTENMRLYIYLQQKMAGDEVNTALVRSFRKEMDGIAKTALEFLEKYNEIEKNSEVELSSFAEEFDQIGSVVSTRMKREEETLYPLYAANY